MQVFWINLNETIKITVIINRMRRNKSFDVMSKTFMYCTEEISNECRTRSSQSGPSAAQLTELASFYSLQQLTATWLICCLPFV